MAQGGVAHQRNQLWPQHHVSYDGFSDVAAWVREKSDTRLRISLYSFATQAESGGVRLWRLAPGTYRIRLGVDEDLDADRMPRTWRTPANWSASPAYLSGSSPKRR